MDTVRLGVIGIGNMGSFHVNATQKLQRARLTAVCDIVPEKLQRFIDADFQTFTDAGELIRSGEVDAVIIATPHYFHTTIGIEALEQGLHVLTEKPISVHKADCERLIAAHKNPSQVFAAMFNQRTDPHYKRIRRLVESGELGEVQRIAWTITNWFRPDVYYASGDWRATWAGEGGGVLLNQCPHNLDLLQWMLGMPNKVRAFAGWGKYHDIEVEDEITAYLEFPNGATGVFVTTTGEAPGTNRLEIVGDRGNLVYDGGIVFQRTEQSVREFCRTTDEAFGCPASWRCEVPVNGYGGQHTEVLQNFVDAILDGVPLIAPAEEGIRSVELANAMIWSARTDQTVDLPLDGAGYEAMLKDLIATSRYERKAVRSASVDMSKSFH